MGAATSQGSPRRDLKVARSRDGHLPFRQGAALETAVGRAAEGRIKRVFVLNAFNVVPPVNAGIGRRDNRQQVAAGAPDA